MPDTSAAILARWGELLAAATPGDWAVMRDADGVITSRVGPVASVFVADRDLALIVELRNTAEVVIRHVAELEAERDEAIMLLNESRTWLYDGVWARHRDIFLDRLVGRLTEGSGE